MGSTKKFTPFEGRAFSLLFSSPYLSLSLSTTFLLSSLFSLTSTSSSSVFTLFLFVCLLGSLPIFYQWRAVGLLIPPKLSRYEIFLLVTILAIFCIWGCLISPSLDVSSENPANSFLASASCWSPHPMKSNSVIEFSISEPFVSNSPEVENLSGGVVHCGTSLKGFLLNDACDGFRVTKSA